MPRETAGARGLSKVSRKECTLRYALFVFRIVGDSLGQGHGPFPRRSCSLSLRDGVLAYPAPFPLGRGIL